MAIPLAAGDTIRAVVSTVTKAMVELQAELWELASKK